METTEHILEGEDLLLKQIIFPLTQQQEEFLYLHLDEPRPVLFKSFRKNFNLCINKVQFNLALGKIKENLQSKPKITKKKRTAKSLTDNVYWVPSRKKYLVQFSRKKERIHVGYYTDREKAIQVAEEFRKANPGGTR